MTADQLITSARDQVGTPFRHMGRTPGKYLDCAGFAIYLADAIGAERIDVEAYGRVPVNGLLESTLDSQPCLNREHRAPQSGDLLLMRFRNEPQHLALCAGETIIHAYQSAGKVCEHIFTEQWRSRVVRVYSFVGVEP